MNEFTKLLIRRQKEKEKYFKNYFFYARKIKKEAERLLGKVQIFVFGSILRKNEVPQDIDVLIVSPKIKKAGAVVYEPILNDDPKINELPEHFKRFSFLGLTHHHFSVIRKADLVFFYNKDGYLGNSSTLELGFAEALGKPVYALSLDKDEPCRNILFDEIIKTPKELIKKLK